MFYNTSYFNVSPGDAWRVGPGERRGTAGRRGFTLLEILAAFFLLLLFLAPVLYLLQSSTRGMALNQDEVTGHVAAFELIEQVLSLPYDDVPVGVFGDARIGDGLPMASGTSWVFRIAATGRFLRQLEISETVTGGRARYKKIAVTVTFPPPPGAVNPRTLVRTVLYAKETR